MRSRAYLLHFFRHLVFQRLNFFAAVAAFLLCAEQGFPDHAMRCKMVDIGPESHGIHKVKPVIRINITKSAVAGYDRGYALVEIVVIPFEAR